MIQRIQNNLCAKGARPKSHVEWPLTSEASGSDVLKTDMICIKYIITWATENVGKPLLVNTVHRCIYKGKSEAIDQHHPEMLLTSLGLSSSDMD